MNNPKISMDCLAFPFNGFDSTEKVRFRFKFFRGPGPLCIACHGGNGGAEPWPSSAGSGERGKTRTLGGNATDATGPQLATTDKPYERAKYWERPESENRTSMYLRKSNWCWSGVEMSAKPWSAQTRLHHLAVVD